ncbi:hypothetical protein ACVIGB_010240 [Bradyrhizobium sp. USDA 4341]
MRQGKGSGGTPLICAERAGGSAAARTPSFRAMHQYRTPMRSCALWNLEVAARDSGFMLRMPQNDGLQSERAIKTFMISLVPP